MNHSSEFTRCLLSKNLTDYYDLTTPVRYWSEIGLLSVFNVFVVMGNCLVLMAFAIDRQLRTPTHYFIGSLAVADLALGIFVLPFATTLQIRGYWIFGSFFCQIWLAFDVWLCTASIYSLIAVTFDRFIAVTKPLTYKLIMTRRKASILIVVVWVAALVICLPAFAFSLHRTGRLSSVTCQCTQMAHSTVYIAYSSIGSFYLPMMVIIYLYARIYVNVRKIRLSGSTGIVSIAKSAMAGGAAAMAAAHAGTANMKKSLSYDVRVRQHEKLTDKGRQLSATLRVHKGKYQPANVKCNLQKKKHTDRLLNLNRSFNSSQSLQSSDLTAKLTNMVEIDKYMDNRANHFWSRDRSKYQNEHHELIVVDRVDDDDQDLETDPLDTGSFRRTNTEENLDCRYLKVNSMAGSYPSTSSNSPRGSISVETRLIEQEISAAAQSASTIAGAQNPATAAADLWLHIIMPSQLTSLWCHRMTVFQKYQKKFTLELKALKTVGIVTGCFFACWLGFCIVYTMQALPNCRAATFLMENTQKYMELSSVQTTTAASSSYSSIGSCVPDWVTSLMVWFGYVNSAINPIIYGVSNKQFRKTFRRIIRCDVSWKGWSLRGIQ